MLSLLSSNDAGAGLVVAWGGHHGHHHVIDGGGGQHLLGWGGHCHYWAMLGLGWSSLGMVIVIVVVGM